MVLCTASTITDGSCTQLSSSEPGQAVRITIARAMLLRRRRRTMAQALGCGNAPAPDFRLNGSHGQQFSGPTRMNDA